MVSATQIIETSLCANQTINNIYLVLSEMKRKGKRVLQYGKKSANQLGS